MAGSDTSGEMLFPPCRETTHCRSLYAKFGIRRCAQNPALCAARGIIIALNHYNATDIGSPGNAHLSDLFSPRRTGSLSWTFRDSRSRLFLLASSSRTPHFHVVGHVFFSTNLVISPSRTITNPARTASTREKTSVAEAIRIPANRRGAAYRRSDEIESLRD